MQLSKLEINGFKSFADKTVINFDEGITGIVGPNGCGKSNIVDAIRWVLGEQKISLLRSEKMDNIIFNGTRKHPALQLAEVSLTINNTKNIIPIEYAQVTITRRVYRSGESEYLLNKVPCRLKDITNLFLDTGISSNSYAIIELGMVDDLLTDRDSARKVLFEEAAGISKFRKRKKETLRKVAATDADMERVNDLLFEIERNMKGLQKQAKQASNYYKLKETYQQKSIQLARIVVKKQKEQFENINKQVAAEKDRKTELTAAIATKEAAIEDYRNTLLKREKELSAHQKMVNDHTEHIRQCESEKQIKSERLQSLQDRATHLKTLIQQDRESNRKIQESITTLEAEKESAQNAFSHAVQKAESLKTVHEAQQRSTAALQNEVEELRKEYYKQQNEYYRLNKELEICKTQIISLTQEANRTHIDADQKHANITDFENKLGVLQNTVSEKKARLASLKQQEAARQQDIAALEKEMDATRMQMSAAGRKLDARKNEYQLTRSLIENMEGFPEAIKFLKKNATWDSEAVLLSDIISTTEEYRVAIENYLEPYLNYYIASSRTEALHAIITLGKAQKGKANFFLLEAFKNFVPTAVQNYIDAFPAIQIVEYNKKYEKLAHYILDKVYVHTGDINTMPVADKNNFITPNGTITRGHYSLSGGSTGLFEGKKIGRRKNLENLEKEIEELTRNAESIAKTLKNQQQELERLREKTLQQKIEEVQHEVETTNNQYISLGVKKEQFLQMLDTAGLHQKDVQQKIESLQKEARELAPKAQQMLTELRQTKQRLDHVTGELKIESNTLAQQLAASNQQSILVHQQKNNIKSIEQEIQFKKESIDQGSVRIKSNTTELQKNEKEIHEIIAAAKTADQTLANMYAQKEDIDRKLNEMEKKYYAAKAMGRELESELRSLHSQRQDTDNALIQLQDQLNESKLNLNSLKERLSIEFNVNLDKIIEQNEENQQQAIGEEAAFRSQIEEIKDKMDKMGAINPMALEAFEEIKERNDFIKAQKEDLIKARESLFNTVEKIEATAERAFMEAFEKIQGHFTNIFRSLFYEEDECSLSLADPSNILESEINIVAKPAGKQPLTINQLSGGEKTLTAIALLFAVYLLKPAPFCILDEVDAPLDDANIDKFNSTIRNFSKNSQFIIVTHNKRTMMGTDVIYGITMVEKGISKIVPVNLKELAKA